MEKKFPQATTPSNTGDPIIHILVKKTLSSQGRTIIIEHIEDLYLDNKILQRIS